jgi:putative ABC transport system permease protein
MSEDKRPGFALSFGFTLREAILTIAANPVQTAFHVAGTLLGAATAIAALGVSATSQSQVDSVFDIYAQTQVTVVTDDADGPRLPSSEARIEELPGVVAATTVAQLQVVARQGDDHFGDSGGGDYAASVYAIGPSAVSALELGDWTGRPIDAGFHSRADAVAVVGAGVADELGLTPPYGDSTVLISGERVTVIGVFAASPREHQLTQAVLVPRSWADDQGLVIEAQQLIIRVDVGAADAIAGRAPSVVDPFEPDRVLASAPPTAESLRAQVASEVGVFVFVMAAGALLVGSIGISNTALVGVLRRTGEFSLRRALGATPRDIARLVVVEGAILGLVAGLLGAVVGMVVVVGVAWIAGWTPLLEIGWVVLVALGASFLGALFSAYPARRAGSIEPASGLRQL